MIKRTIMIFPEFKEMETINKIRQKYDPLYEHVPGHVTLVFTFESDLSTAVLKDHLDEVLKNFKPFELKMKDLIKIDNNLGKYLFLGVEEGDDQLKRISKSLYSGLLEAYRPTWLNDKTYLPHLTLGVFNQEADLQEAFDYAKKLEKSYQTLVKKISVEIVDDNEDSIIEFDCLLES